MNYTSKEITNVDCVSQQHQLYRCLCLHNGGKGILQLMHNKTTSYFRGCCVTVFKCVNIVVAIATYYYNYMCVMLAVL